MLTKQKCIILIDAQPVIKIKNIFFFDYVFIVKAFINSRLQSKAVSTAVYYLSLIGVEISIGHCFSFKDIPAYRGKAVVTVNDNVPFFTPAEIVLAKQGHFEYYGDLDDLGRCTVAFDCLGKETMPNGQKRGSISAIRPTGWKQARYDCVDSETVMTRAHLAGYMLST